MVKRKKQKPWKKILIYLFSLGFISLGLISFWISSFKMPDLRSFDERTVSQSTKIYDRTGEVLLFDVNRDIKRKVITYEEISPLIKKATVAIEDADFYNHRGIKIKSIIRAIIVNLIGGQFNQGGSTITQQVIKNSLLTSEKAISRKLKEWVLAMRLERMMSKEEILTIYLNESPYGGSIYGIEEASQTFFKKKASDITLAEAAYLAAIPNAPTYYSPYGNNKDKLDARKNLVLQKMLDNNFITEDEYKKALIEEVIFYPRIGNSLKAAHFVEYIREYLEERYGEKIVRENGLKIITTLDYSLQEKAEEIVNKYALENEKNFNAENASLVAIDPKTGEILVMVGSRDYFDKEIDGNFNIATAYRQPGSTFKPFVYATAFKKGYTPETILFDLPTEFQTTCTPQGTPIGNNSASDCYMPENYDDKYLGPLTLKEALAQSRNVPSVKALYLAGIKDSLQTARDLGITSLGPASQYGLTLVLGGGEVSLLELTSAYSVFANAGIKNSHFAILKIEDANGKVLEENKPYSETALSEDIANKISDILSDNVARTPAYGSNSQLHFKDRPVAVKTGTTNDFRDVWIVGYTPNLAVGAWAGNNDNTSIEKKVAGLVIAPMWRAFMDQALPSFPKEYFGDPGMPLEEVKPVFRGIWQGYDSFTIDKISGKLATDLTPKETRQEVFIPNVHEILYWVNKDNPHGEIPNNPNDDPQFRLWEYPVQIWAQNNPLPYPQKPNSYDDVHTKANSPKVNIISPLENWQYKSEEKIMIQINYQAVYPLKKVDFYFNNNYIGSTEKTQFLFSFIPKEMNNLSDSNSLKVVATDSVYNRGEAEIQIQIEN